MMKENEDNYRTRQKFLNLFGTAWKKKKKYGNRREIVH